MGACVKTQSNAALVRDYDDAAVGAVQLCNCRFHSGKNLEATPVRDVFSFRWFSVDDTVPVKEDVANVRHRET